MTIWKNEEAIRQQLYIAETLLHKAQPIDQHYYLWGVQVALRWLFEEFEEGDFPAPTDSSRLKKRSEDDNA